MGEKTKGLYRKFTVNRTDGKSDPGQKHEACEYFVLDLSHDEHSIAAIEAYAKSCYKDYPHLAEDLEKLLRILRARFPSSGGD